MGLLDTYVTRLNDEDNELSIKTYKLERFLADPKTKLDSLGPDANLLPAQLHAMRAYKAILGLRLALIKAAK
jgi:hypothetical protein